MSKDNFIKEFLFSQKKKIKRKLSLFSIKLKRLTVSNNLTESDSYNVPIIINNYNRYTYLLQLIAWLEKNNYSNIYILDNASTYPKLLEYYKTTKHKVIFLNKNVGYKALWQSAVFEKFKKGFYVYTDPDVVPNNNCPSDIVFKLYKILNKYSGIEKCGPALNIGDIPDFYGNKNDVIKWENEHWLIKIEADLYDAPIDTTFALYKPYAMGEAEICKAYRLAGNYSFLHLPWYVNSNELSEEEQYYINSINKNQSHWIK